LFVPGETASEFADLDPLPADVEKSAGCVVVGDPGNGWDFETLNRAFRLLMGEPRPVLVALGMTRYWRAADGLRLDAGAFVRALEYASGATAVVTGKPDNGAQQAGFAGVLVRTGKSGASYCRNQLGGSHVRGQSHFHLATVATRGAAATAVRTARS
jgi:hypothetical protein